MFPQLFAGERRDLNNPNRAFCLWVAKLSTPCALSHLQDTPLEIHIVCGDSAQLAHSQSRFGQQAVKDAVGLWSRRKDSPNLRIGEKEPLHSLTRRHDYAVQNVVA